MRILHEFTTDLTALTHLQYDAIVKPSGQIFKTIELNIGCNIGDAPQSLSSMRAKFENYFKDYKEQAEEIDFALWEDDEFMYHHKAGEASTKILSPSMQEMEITESTIVSFIKTNLPLSAIIAFVKGLCYELEQDAIPMFMITPFLDTGYYEPRVEYISYGKMIGRTKESANKWGVFNPEFFIS